jgi:hypothetical protein
VCILADVPPIPLTPDYGGPVVSYADGVLDTRFNRFIAVREGKWLRISLSLRFMLDCPHCVFYFLNHSFIWSLMYNHIARS